ncbi:M23 family metallopeptidase [Bacillus sp. 1NLA3E]|uniref:M23 family metallopeptidase n=1 Tax=Bacillus sp. 1NLA3E TaxID=666686 RepID=UPI000247ED46|nr:M23 family metallopeptidase [Bacillus sp. 1NLA3E]AGK56170.1 metalloprotease yebA [Bacillus sp. 1NLA3E]
MSKWKMSLSNLTGNTTARLIPQVKKVAITAIAVTALSFSLLHSAPLASGSETTTVYYVYFNEKYIGTVSDKKVVETVVKNKLQELKANYNGVNLSTGSQLTYIPEQVFRSSVTTNNQKVVQELQEQLTIQADATAVALDDQQVVFLENQQSAEEVVKKLKLQYVSEDQLNAIEARKNDPASTLPPLQENETRILDVRLSKNVSYAKAAVTPDKIMTVDNAVKFLQTGTLEQQKYQVQDGDVLGSIANGHGLTLKQMVEINPGLTEDSVLKIGQEVNITVFQPYIHVLVDKQSLVKEAIPYTSQTVEDASRMKGDNTVKQQGQNGERQATYQISEQSGQTVSKQEISSNILTQPVNEVIVKGTKVVPSRGDGTFAWPTGGGYISSQMGYRDGKLHKGIDIARPSNPTIKAADNGVVVSAGWDGGYGNKIVIDHQNGFRTVYGHLSSIGVRVGQTVAKGSSIGVMGSTGDSTGTHLHFEVYKNGALQNPVSYLR